MKLYQKVRAHSLVRKLYREFEGKRKIKAQTCLDRLPKANAQTFIKARRALHIRAVRMGPCWWWIGPDSKNRVSLTDALSSLSRKDKQSLLYRVANQFNPETLNTFIEALKIVMIEAKYDLSSKEVQKAMSGLTGGKHARWDSYMAEAKKKLNIRRIWGDEDDCWHWVYIPGELTTEIVRDIFKGQHRLTVREFQKRWDEKGLSGRIQAICMYRNPKLFEPEGKKHIVCPAIEDRGASDIGEQEWRKSRTKKRGRLSEEENDALIIDASEVSVR